LDHTGIAICFFLLFSADGTKQHSGLEYSLETKCLDATSALLGLQLSKTMRVLMVGREGAGKTLLRKQMQGRVYDGAATHFLEMDDDWMVDDMRLLLWDFAGQLGYSAARSLFLGDVRPDQLAVVLCVDVRMSGANMQSTLEQWLGILCQGQQSCGARMGVAVIGTHCGLAGWDQAAEETLATQLSALLSTDDFSQLLLLRDGENLVWRFGEDDVQCARRLRRAIVEHGKRGSAQLACPRLHDTLALVCSKASPTGVALLQDLGEREGLQDDLAQLHAHGLIFYQPGARAVCANVRVPLAIFKGLLQHSYPRVDVEECYEVGWLWESSLSLKIEHNALWDSAGQRICLLRDALVSNLLASSTDGIVFTIIPRDAAPLTLRFADAERGKRFVRCLALNRLDKSQFDYRIPHSQICVVLERLYPGNTLDHTLLLELLVSSRVLALRCAGKPNELQKEAAQYLLPSLVPSTNLASLLQWRSESATVCHARKYVISVDATAQLRMQSVVLVLVTMWDAHVDEHLWLNVLDRSRPVGAWQRSVSHSAFYECRYNAHARKWSIYVFVCETHSTQLIGAVHQTLVQWCGAEFGLGTLSVWVAPDASTAAPDPDILEARCVEELAEL
jgi:hypothetical protein